MKILVTGSEGNIGCPLVKYLQLKGHEVLCLDIKQDYRNNYILSNIINLSDAEEEIIKFNPTIVFHLAAMVSRITCEKAPSTAVQINIIGTMNIIQLCKRLNAKLINFSTSEVYGNLSCELEEDISVKPNNIYGITKRMAEQLVEYESKSNGLKYINVRPFMIYDENETMGENRSVMIRFAENIIKGIPITVHKDSNRGWLHISDAVVLFEKLIYIYQNITINVGNYNYLPTKELANIMYNYENIIHKNTEYTDLPDKMTLSKKATFNLQKKLLKYEPQKTIEKGIELVMKTVRKKLNLNMIEP